VAVAVVGTVSSFGIPRVPASSPGTKIRLDPWSEIVAGMKRLYGDRVLWLTVVGLSYFWFLGALLQAVMMMSGIEVLKQDDRWVGVLVSFAAVGIAIGSLVAGRLSGDKVELGLAPIGSIGMGASAILLSLSTQSYAAAAINLTLVGFFGGLFAVPLNALLQQRSEGTEKGRLMATNNFLNMAAVLLASAALWICRDFVGLTPNRIILLFGLVTLASSVYVLAVVPEFLIRFSLWLLTHTLYRIRIVGQENVPLRGPALLIANHISHVDGLLVGSCVQRFIRFLVYRPYYEFWAFHWLLKMMRAIPIAAGNRRELVSSLEEARQALVNGHVVCIFAEGSISRTGNLLPFKRGFERIVQGLDVPVVPVYLDRVWGSVFSFKGGKFFWKWPARVPYPVTVAFGRPLGAGASAAEARLAIMELGCEVASEQRPNDVLARRFIKTAKRRWWSFCMADSTGTRLTFGRVLVGSLLMSRWLRVHRAGESKIGLLLPASVGGAIANAATSLSGKVAVNLNFTAGREAMSRAIQQCEIRTILTSRRFLDKASIEPLDGMVFVEDLLGQMSGPAKLSMFVAAYLLPASVLTRIAVHGDGGSDRLATVIFSSGSTGIPKGVMLTHRNVLSNIDAIAQLFQLRSTDVLVGVLPFFHSFGFTATLWFPLVAGFGVAYHANPLDAKTVGELAGRYRATFLIATPTFCSAYIRKCQPQQFAHLRYAIVGAEKLREPLARAFFERFGVHLLEGYGCTEMSPVVAINVPDIDDRQEHQVGVKPGSVGHPVPGVVAKVVDPETGEGPLFDREGLLLVNGPNRMAGYLGDPAKTAEVLRDGWYVTGDIAAIDSDGFIVITDRLSRFSKIGGEMVPHMKIEESINELLDENERAVVTSVTDEVKGERLVAFYTDPAVNPRELWERLCRTELPRLWLPKREDLHFIESIPTLGTGKVDLRAVRTLASERAAVAAS